MADTYSTSNRFEKMEPGQYLDTWGSRLNGNVIDLVDAAIDGVVSFALSGSKTLTNNNGSTDEARCRVLDVTSGTGGTITIPNVTKNYIVRNATSGDVVITTGSGTTATVLAGNTRLVLSMGSNVVRAASITSLHDTAGTVRLAVTTTGADVTGAFTSTSAAITNAITASRIACTDASGEAGNFTVSTSNNVSAAIAATHASYAAIALRVAVTRASSSAFDLISARNNATDVAFRVRGDGVVYSDGGTAMTTPADYADAMEWADGNPDGEDRVGYSVVLVGEKVRKATAADDPDDVIGIVSADPSIIGGSGALRWVGQYETDEFGRQIHEEYEVVEWTEVVEPTEGNPDPQPIIHSYAVEALPKGVVPPDGAVYSTHERLKVAANYDPSAAYVPRLDRAEWDPIGLCGRVKLRKGCPVNPRWRKMRDISVTVEEWLVR